MNISSGVRNLPKSKYLKDKWKKSRAMKTPITIPHHSGEECEHEIGRRMEGGFPGHPHVHPSGFQQCLNCGKTLAELLTTTRQELAQDIINDLESNPNPDGSVSPNIMHYVERMQMKLRAKYLPPLGLAGTE